MQRLSIPAILALAVLIALPVAALIAPTAAHAAEIWLDTDGDGLPQGSPLWAVDPGDEVTLDVWINSGSFSWTNYLVYLHLDTDCLSLSSADYVIRGSNFPVDDFSDESAIGFGGLGFDASGSDLIARITLRVESPQGCCVKPLTEVVDDEESVWSQLGAGERYALFEETDGICFESTEGRDVTSWGGIKGLYK